MLNLPKSKLKADPPVVEPATTCSQAVSHDILHSDKLSRIKKEIDALKSGESLTEKIDTVCFNEVWGAYINETRNHRQGGLGKLQIDYVGETMTVTNVEPKKPAPTPTPAPTPNVPVFPEPDND